VDLFHKYQCLFCALATKTDLMYLYRDELKRNYNTGQYWLEVNLEDLASFDEELADSLTKRPTEYVAIVNISSLHLLCLLCI